MLFAFGLAIIMGLLTALLPRVLGDIHLVFERLPFIKPLVTALLGVDPGRQLSAAMSQAFLWVHPTVLSIIWAHEVMYCTRVPANEIDRATIDYLLGLPISRWQLFLSESLGWLASGVFILACGFCGHLSADQFARSQMRPPWSSTAFVMINLLSVYFAVGSVAFLVSASSDRRNRAIGIVFGLLLFSFLINFLAQFWDPLSGLNGKSQGGSSIGVVQPTAIGLSTAQDNLGINRQKASSKSAGSKITNDLTSDSIEPTGRSGSWSIASLSVMHYYRPATIIQTGKFPTADVLILISMGFTSWLCAGLSFSRRTICTV
jgi:ABC-type transport system involved in multi-copper enzyme maturation permease subunit